MPGDAPCSTIANRSAPPRAWRHFVETPLDRLLARAEAGGDPAQATLALSSPHAGPGAGLWRASSPSTASIRRRSASRPISPACRSSPRPTTSSATRWPSSAAAAGWRAATCMAVSSGSTGEPTFWPRFVADELADRRALRAGLPATASPPTSGARWPSSASRSAAGSAACSRWPAAAIWPPRAIRSSTLAPGINKPEIYRVLTELGARLRPGRAAGLSALSQGRDRRRAGRRHRLGEAARSGW